MATLQEQIREVEEEIKKTTYNKATSFHIGRLKAKLAKLHDEVEKKSSSGGTGEGYSVKKSGDATVTLVGFPSVGKSTLLNKLTDANSEVGAYAFTTLTVVPGVMEYKGAIIQILDVPGLVKGAASGRGRGKEVIAVIRSSDLVIFLLDVFQPTHYQVLMEELYEAGIRIDQTPPDVVIKKVARGGIQINSTVELEYIDEDTIKSIMDEYKIHNASVLLRENVTVDQFIDVVAGNRSYVSSMIVINKVDLANQEIMAANKQRFPDAVFISAHNSQNLDMLREVLYDRLGFIRVYMKPQGEAADLEEPMIVLRNTDVGQICDRLHKDFRKKFRFAYVWGKSAKHPGQRVGLEHKLMDGDILSVVIQK